jgi:hypothetical protein
MKYELSSPAETERLVLRPMMLLDAEAIHAFQSLPEIAQPVLGAPQSGGGPRETRRMGANAPAGR